MFSWFDWRKIAPQPLYTITCCYKVKEVCIIIQTQSRIPCRKIMYVTAPEASLSSIKQSTRFHLRWIVNNHHYYKCNCMLWTVLLRTGDGWSPPWDPCVYLLSPIATLVKSPAMGSFVSVDTVFADRQDCCVCFVLSPVLCLCLFFCLFQCLLIILCKHAYALRPAVIFCSLVARLDHGPLRFTWHYFIISMHMHVIRDHCLQALLLKWIPPQCQHCYASISSNLYCETIIFHCCNNFLWLLFDIVFFCLLIMWK